MLVNNKVLLNNFKIISKLANNLISLTKIQLKNFNLTFNLKITNNQKIYFNLSNKS